MTPIDPNAVYGKAQVADLFGVSTDTVDRWELARTLPPSYQQGRLRFWLGSALLADQRRKQNKALTEAGLPTHALATTL